MAIESIPSAGEQTVQPLSLPAASLRRRLASMGYEALLLLGITSVTFMLPHLALGIGYGVAAPKLILRIHFVAVLAVYFVWFWRSGGQTLAMQTWRIRLVSVRGQGAISMQQALLRYGLAWFSLLFCGAGLLWALFDRDRQFLHDRLSGTRLVQLPRRV
jgi:uncharacterized RDD family membrane protein YckC